MKGQILHISYSNGLFFLKIDHLNKTFKSHQEMDKYLIRVLKQAKDPKKLAMLKEDLSNYFKKI